ncbi:MAG: hypothetical protein RLZZ179_298 [Verrucomicrobiota bacterium]|jgi:hypothetical protein
MNIRTAVLECARAFPLARVGDRKSGSHAMDGFCAVLNNLLPDPGDGGFVVKGSLGAGTMAAVPWAAVFHSSIGTGASEGYYVVFLFSEDSKRVYLTLEAAAGIPMGGAYGVGSLERTASNALILRARSDELENYGFQLSSDLDLALDPAAKRPKSYAAGAAAYKMYEIGNLPEVEEMENDFRNAVGFFLELVRSGFRLGVDEKDDVSELAEVVVSRSPVGTGGSRRFPSTPLIRSLLAKPFLILTGPSGTGKTRGAVRLAEELCGDGGRWVVVAVGADWTDNRHVVGYLNPLERDGGVAVYESTAVLELVMRANEHPDEVHALILDEMNLSHVERYFADFLSAMELADGRGALRLHGAGRARTRVGREVAGAVDFPGNLLVIGTVNIDETTYMFSPKVLDRANVVEMEADGEGLRRVLLGDGDGDDGVGGGEDRGVGFLEVARVIRGGREDVVVPSLPDGVRAGVVARLLELHRILARGRGEFGYRTGKEVMAYLRASYFLMEERERTVWEAGGWEAALDEQILQKILPKLHGSRSRLGPLLGALARYCAGGSEEEAMKHYPAGGRSAVYGLQDVRALEGAKFGRSYRKLARMIEVLVEEQFVSFIC